MALGQDSQSSGGWSRSFPALEGVQVPVKKSWPTSRNQAGQCVSLSPNAFRQLVFRAGLGLFSQSAAGPCRAGNHSMTSRVALFLHTGAEGVGDGSAPADRNLFQLLGQALGVVPVLQCRVDRIARQQDGVLELVAMRRLRVRNRRCFG